MHQKCDKVADCSDGTDEIGCQYRPCHGDTNTTAGPNDFKCSNNGNCIPLTKKCDGYFDCRDKSDEVACPNR